MVYIKTYVFNHFYYQYLVLLTMVRRNRYAVEPRGIRYPGLYTIKL